MAETLGWLTDKLIIAELKIFYTNEQIEREDADEAHRNLCGQRILVLTEQRNDLKNEMNELLQNLLRGKAAQKIYRQFKMYNDPRFLIHRPARNT